jgi:hypothetical protein
MRMPAMVRVRRGAACARSCGRGHRAHLTLNGTSWLARCCTLNKVTAVTGAGSAGSKGPRMAPRKGSRRLASQRKSAW